MRFQTILLLIGLLALGAVACVPNRLTHSLPAAPAEQADALEIVPTPDGRNLQPQLATARIDPDEVVALLPPDAIPAVMPEDAPTIMVSAQAADEAGMAPTTRVLGLNINDDSRAYPIPFMSSHEIVNETVGGRLIAATW